MNRPTHLTGEIDSPAGRAPESAWKPVDGQVKRPADIWLAGDTLKLLGDGQDWKRKIPQRVQTPEGTLGLRLRFVCHPDESRVEADLVSLVGEVLEMLEPSLEGRLFVHAEIMWGPEPGLHIAFDNRPPALLTQAWIHNRTINEGELPELSGPLHLNLMLHDQDVRFGEIWNDGTLRWVLDLISKSHEPHPGQSAYHELTLARSDAKPHGISVGLERVHEKLGAYGGSPAAGMQSRVQRSA